MKGIDNGKVSWCLVYFESETIYKSFVRLNMLPVYILKPKSYFSKWVLFVALTRFKGNRHYEELRVHSDVKENDLYIIT